MPNAAKILQEQSHRQWAIPQRPWLMTNTWSQLLFAHWPLEPELIQPLLPDGLELDTFDGQAWIAVVPFRMGFRLRFSPYEHIFSELNVRTYVKRDGKPGVFFFSLDASDRFTVVSARQTYALPYFLATMQRLHLNGKHRFHSQRKGTPPGSNQFSGTYRPIGPVYHAQAGSLEHWLTERYCLYSVRRDGTIYRGEVHHLPWPLQRAEAVIEANTVLDGTGLFIPPGTEPLLHYADHLDIVIWAPQKL